MRRTCLIALCLLTTSACSRMPFTLIAPPPELFQEAQPLPAFDGTTARDLTGYTITVVGMYHVLAAENNAKAHWIKGLAQ